MIKKLMPLALAVGFSLAVLTGCSKKPTVESLVDGMFDSEIESQKADIEADIKLSPTAQGVSFDITIGGDFEMQVSGMNGKDDLTTYIDGKVSMKAPAFSVDEKLGFETYSIVDDETLTCYACADDGVWYTEELDDVWDQDAYDKMIEEMKDVLKENGELAEDTEKVEGEECYVITATVKGRDCVAIFKPMKGMIDDVIDEVIDDAIHAAMKKAGMNVGIDIDVNIDMVSWSEYWAADITCYISKDTGYLVKTEIDMSDTDIYGMAEQMLKDLVSAAEQMLKDLGQEEGLDFVQDAIDDALNRIEDISVSKFDISVVIYDVDDTEVEVPDDVIDDAVEIFDADALGDFMGSIDDDVIEEPPVEPDRDIIGTDPDDGDNIDSFTFNKDYEDDEFLCEVKVPNGWTVDVDFFDSEYGLVCLDTDNSNGYIWVQNYLSGAMYYSLLNGGELPVDEYDWLDSYNYNYNMEITVIGTAFGGSDVMLVKQSYDSEDGWTSKETYVCIEYDDGGNRQFLSIDCDNIYDLDDWTEDDFLDLAVSLFGR